MRKLLLTLVLIAAVALNSYGQFNSSRTNYSNTTSSQLGPPGSESTSQQVGEDGSEVTVDSTQGFSIKRMVRGFARKDTLTPGYLALGTAIVPGLGQVYNKQYWKIPVTYAGIGAGIGTGIAFNNKYKETGEDKYKTLSTIGYIGAGVFYWSQILDGVANLKVSYRKPVPAKAAIYSALLPGLGQAYNGDWWKIPIWYTGFIACGYFYHTNDMGYKRFKYIYDMDSDKANTGYTGGITASQAEWYKTTYRRYRDYSILGFVLVYALNIIDANVFAHMHDFDVSDNIASVELEPALITPINAEYACNVPGSASSSALGLNFKINF